MDVLGDGKPHTREELFEKCIDDQLSSERVLTFHMVYLRRKMRLLGGDISKYKQPGGFRGYQFSRIVDQS